ncbi:MAG TPA: hypothetical protein VF446_03225 [Trinickia sp.]
MKSFKLIPVGAALALYIAASASAFAVTVSPAGSISLTGSTTLTKSGIAVGCSANMVGSVTSAGAISITSASFSGNALCAGVTATGLPWTGQVLSTTSLSLSGVAVHTLLGACEPSTISAAVTENPNPQQTIIGLSNQALSGGCSVSGSLTTTPYLSIQ